MNLEILLLQMILFGRLFQPHRVIPEILEFLVVLETQEILGNRLLLAHLLCQVDQQGL